jgi:expansin (peptidoglycan-binding protein)
LALLVVAAAAGLAPAASAGDMYSSYSEYGYAGFSPGGALYINALPSNAEVRLDGVLVGVANDLQASVVDARPGFHTLTFQAPGYEATIVYVRVVRDWTTRVRLTLIPAR